MTTEMQLQTAPGGAVSPPSAPIDAVTNRDAAPTPDRAPTPPARPAAETEAGHEVSEAYADGVVVRGVLLGIPPQSVTTEHALDALDRLVHAAARVAELEAGRVPTGPQDGAAGLDAAMQRKAREEANALVWSLRQYVKTPFGCCQHAPCAAHAAADALTERLAALLTAAALAPSPAGAEDDLDDVVPVGMTPRAYIALLTDQRDYAHGVADAMREQLTEAPAGAAREDGAWEAVDALVKARLLDAEDADDALPIVRAALPAGAARTGEDVRLRALLPAVQEWNERHGEDYDGICERCFTPGQASLFAGDGGANVCESCSAPTPPADGGARHG